MTLLQTVSQEDNSEKQGDAPFWSPEDSPGCRSLIQPIEGRKALSRGADLNLSEME